MKRKPPAPPSGKKRGGQPGRRKAHRALVPPEKVRETFQCKPVAGRRCGHELVGDDPEPLIHQVAELPRIQPFVDEYRLHRLACPACRASTRAIAKTRGGDVARALLGSEDGQVVGSDRFSAYSWIMAKWRQICWAHLRRDFQAMIDRGGDGEATGRRLLSLSNRLFRNWHRVRDGTQEWSSFQKRMSGLRREVKQALLEGSQCSCAKTAATCFEILKVEEGLWTFARVQGVEPTNNAVERALRHAVIWRRVSGGTDSAGGSRFVERMMTVVATCRQQGRNVLDYLTTCFEADRQGHVLPSLLPVATAEADAA